MKLDSQIQDDVMQELKWDPSVSHEHIGVSVKEGIVTLSGTIPNYAEKISAEKAAQRVEGVKAVIEKIEVKLPGSLKRDDQDIAEAVVNQLRWNVQVPDERIKVSVENGWVELQGEVDWTYQKITAEDCVKGLIGVVGVINLLNVKAKKIDTEAVKKNIEEALKRKAEREARHIDVEVSGSNVTLSGRVHSFADMEDAKWAAWSAPGVSTVDNNLQVSP